MAGREGGPSHVETEGGRRAAHVEIGRCHGESKGLNPWVRGRDSPAVLQRKDLASAWYQLQRYQVTVSPSEGMAKVLPRLRLRRRTEYATVSSSEPRAVVEAGAPRDSAGIEPRDRPCVVQIGR